jgi:coenzyme F420-reducing hydrogenase delta subunit
MLRQQIKEESARLQGEQRVLVFACDGSADLSQLQDQQTAVVTLRCMAHLPPAFVDFILSRGHADGVFLAGCGSGNCDYRLGADWTSQRVARERDPRLRASTDRQKLALGWQEQWQSRGAPARRLAAFREQMQLTTSAANATATENKPSRLMGLPLRALAYGLFMVAASAFSAWPAFSLLSPGEAIVSLSISHTGQRIEACHKFTQQELDELPPNMRRPSDCPRERHPIRVEFEANGQVLYSQILSPSGIWNDGSSTIYARFPLAAGEQSLAIGMSDSGAAAGFDYHSVKQLNLQPGQHLVISFDSSNSEFTFTR